MTKLTPRQENLLATERRTLGVQEAARLLGIGKNQAYEAARSGQIPALRIGGRWVIPREAFERMLREGRQAQSTEAAR